MKTNTLITLAFTLFIALGLSVWLTRDNQTQGLDSQPLLGEFEEQLASIQSLELRTHDAVLFAAEKVDNEWYATQLSTEHQFPVNFESLSDFINDLNEAELREAKTQNPDNYARLGVENLVVENAQSTLLTLQSDSASFELLIGNPSSNGLGSFVRKPASKRSWLLDRVLSLPTDPYSWLKNPVLDLAVDNVLRVEMLGESGWAIERNEAQTWQLAGMQDFESLTYPTVLSNSLATILEMKFESVQPRITVELPETAEAELVLETDSGLLTMRVFSVNEQHWVIYNYPQQAGLDDWIFGVSDFGKGQLIKLRSDFIESVEEPEAALEP